MGGALRAGREAAEQLLRSHAHSRICPKTFVECPFVGRCRQAAVSNQLADPVSTTWRPRSGEARSVKRSSSTAAACCSGRPVFMIGARSCCFGRPWGRAGAIYERALRRVT